MRLQRYLNEKFYKGMHQRVMAGGDFEVFVNPSSKEMREFSQADPTDRWNGVGYRYVLDFKEKNAYIFSLQMFHETFFNEDPRYPKYTDYWDKGVGLDYLYTGHREFGEDKSDALNHFYGEAKSWTNGGNGYMFREQLNKLANQDWSWTNKYTDANKIQRLVLKAATGK